MHFQNIDTSMCLYKTHGALYVCFLKKVGVFPGPSVCVCVCVWGGGGGGGGGGFAAIGYTVDFGFW